MARLRLSRRGGGAVAFRPGGDAAILAGLGLFGRFLRTLGRRNPLSDEKRPGAAAPSLARRADGGEGNIAKDHHVLHQHWLCRAACRVRARSSLWMVQAISSFDDRRRPFDIARSLHCGSGLSGKQLQLRDDRGRRRPTRDFDRALRGRPPSDVCREFSLSAGHARCAWLLVGVAGRRRGLRPFFAWRLFDEERVLKEKLPGYADYCAKLRWRLIPGGF